MLRIISSPFPGAGFGVPGLRKWGGIWFTEKNMNKKLLDSAVFKEHFCFYDLFKARAKIQIILK